MYTGIPKTKRKVHPAFSPSLHLTIEALNTLKTFKCQFNNEYINFAFEAQAK